MSISNRSLLSGTILTAKYKDVEHRAEVMQGDDGKPRYRLADGREFKSPSAAGKAVTGISCNGWRFWSLAGAKPDKAASGDGGPPASGPTLPNARRTGSAGPRTPAGRKSDHTARTARKAAKPIRAAKAKASKTARKASKPAKRMAKATKR